MTVELKNADESRFPAREPAHPSEHYRQMPPDTNTLSLEKGNRGLPLAEPHVQQLFKRSHMPFGCFSQDSHHLEWRLCHT